MSDEYSYRDARLSVWQSAAHLTHLKYPSPKQAGTEASGGKSQNPFMAPVHVVAATAKGEMRRHDTYSPQFWFVLSLRS
jgi:hypothetical protein